MPAIAPQDWEQLVDEVSRIGYWDAGDVLVVRDTVLAGLHAPVVDWLVANGFPQEVRSASNYTLGCLGSGFHEDSKFYPAEFFCIMWLEDDEDWDLMFPHSGQRIELRRGTVVAFDPANVHGVVSRGSDVFRPEDMRNCTLQLFTSLNMPSTTDVLALFGIQWFEADASSGADAATSQIDGRTGAIQ